MGEGSKGKLQWGQGRPPERRRKSSELGKSWSVGREVGKIIETHLPVKYMLELTGLQFGETHGDQVNCSQFLELSARHGGLSLSWCWVES